jgi:hypothetical protein
MTRGRASQPIRLDLLVATVVFIGVLIGVLSGCGSKTSIASNADVTSVADSSSNPGSDPSNSSDAASTAATTAEADVVDTSSPQTGSATGKVSCLALQEAAARMTVNWQIVLGLGRTPDVSSWSTNPLGTLPEFASQLSTLQRGLGPTGTEAADAIAFMEGANDLVQRGVAGEATAGPALATYLGTDLMKLIQKQMPIGLAMDKVGC